GLPIDIEIVIALSEPAWLILNDTQNRTYVVPSSLNRQNLQALPGYCRQGLAVQGMEVAYVSRQALHLLPVDVIVKIRHSSPPFVGHSDFAGVAKRHRPIAVS